MLELSRANSDSRRGAGTRCTSPTAEVRPRADCPVAVLAVCPMLEDDWLQDDWLPACQLTRVELTKLAILLDLPATQYGLFEWKMNRDIHWALEGAVSAPVARQAQEFARRLTDARRDLLKLERLLGGERPNPKLKTSLTDAADHLRGAFFAMSMRPRRMFTWFISSLMDSPAGARCRASKTRVTSSRDGKALSMK